MSSDVLKFVQTCLERKNQFIDCDISDDLGGDLDGQLSTVTSDDETMDMTDVNQLLYSHDD